MKHHVFLTAGLLFEKIRYAANFILKQVYSFLLVEMKSLQLQYLETEYREC